MAIVGKHNVLELVRLQKTPYWKLYENNNKRTSGNYIDQADTSDSGLEIEASVNHLRQALERLSTGTYVLVAYATKDKSKGGIDTLIEIEGTGGHRSAAINGLEQPSGLYVEGIGKVTSENFAEVIDKRIKDAAEAERKKAEDIALRKEVEQLRRDLKAKEAGINKGLLSIGSIVYQFIKGTPDGKEFIGMAQKAMMSANAANKATGAPDVEDADHEEVDPAVSGIGTPEDQLVQTLEVLSKDNPDLLKQLKKLAEIKQKEPDTFKMAIESLDTL